MHTLAASVHRRFNVREFERMGEFGILPESGIELIDGEVLEKKAGGTPRLWTYDDYLKLGAAGIIGHDERTELINGEIVEMTPIGHWHVYVVDLLTDLLGRWAHGRAVLRVQSPLRFNEVEAPQPDLVLLRMHPDRYRSREAGPWDALLLVEVADSSVTRDRGKAMMYARAAIPEYWLVDVGRSVVVVHTSPVGGEYTGVREFGRDASWTSAALGGETVRGEEVLG